jgi:hypothetical protein
MIIPYVPHHVTQGCNGREPTFFETSNERVSSCGPWLDPARLCNHIKRQTCKFILQVYLANSPDRA